MKKNVLFLTIALFAMFFASCDNNNEEEITLLEYSLKATPTSLTFAPKDAEAQGNKAAVYCTLYLVNNQWTA